MLLAIAFATDFRNNLFLSFIFVFIYLFFLGKAHAIYGSWPVLFCTDPQLHQVLQEEETTAW